MKLAELCNEIAHTRDVLAAQWEGLDEASLSFRIDARENCEPDFSFGASIWVGDKFHVAHGSTSESAFAALADVIPSTDFQAIELRKHAACLIKQAEALEAQTKEKTA